MFIPIFTARLPVVQSDVLSGRGTEEGPCVWVMFLERVVPYGRMMENGDNGENLEGSGYDLFDKVSRNFPERAKENHEKPPGQPILGADSNRMFCR